MACPEVSDKKLVGNAYLKVEGMKIFKGGKEGEG